MGIGCFLMVRWIPTREWAEEFCRQLNSSSIYRNSGRGWVWPILFKVRNIPEDLKGMFKSDTPGFIADLNNGECRGIQWLDDATEADAPFILTGDYRVWLDVIEGKTHPLTAIIRRKLVLEKGEVSKIMRYPVAALEMVKAAQRAAQATSK